MKLIKDLVEEHSIECNLTEMQWIPIFTQMQLDINVKSARTKSLSRLAIRGDYAEEIPFSFPCKSSMIQAQFHPFKVFNGPPLHDSGS
ncbi:hypothetical protein H7T43_03055 [Peribacillus simplex]|uniref:hypothetical protein n=1 Tax=Peribacillus simplex TaxID=1478 RepID=UPI002989C5B4|nr:hypothetical protein [Peribacillus simplex]MBX9953886.1 hypothetical protein [Peribacillus simplex]